MIRDTKIAVDDLVTSTTLESNKSLLSYTRENWQCF